MSSLECTSNDDLLRRSHSVGTVSRPKTKATFCTTDIRDYLRRKSGRLLTIWSMVLDGVSIAHTAALNSLLVRAVATELAASHCRKKLEKGEGFP